MPIKLFDSLTREIRELRQPDPTNPQDVFSFYNCGPTVYAPAHIGNFRTFIVNDVLRRLLELEFGKNKVKHVRNLTDVDDKTIKRARDEGRSLAEVTKQWTDKFHADCDALNCLRPHVEPTATGHIREQVDMIDTLMRKGNAYRAPDGSVYFKVSSFANYGALSRVKERELKTGSAFAADADEKEDLSDFALWKAHKADDGENAWDSPWGRGRPGWHIECSAMSKKHLGDTIDLHTGGVDLLFPHHENEIAQSECCNGQTFSRHWYHSEHLLVDGKKMSKSLGNLYTLDELAEKGFSPMAVRYALLLMGHPRKQLNFTIESLHIAQKALERIYAAMDHIGKRSGLSDGTFVQLTPATIGDLRRSSVFYPCWLALCDDLNTPSTLGEFFVGIYAFEKDAIPKDRLRFELSCALTILNALGIKLEQPKKKPAVEIEFGNAPKEIQELFKKRNQAKSDKNYQLADQLRKELEENHYQIVDTKIGPQLLKIEK
ncbi:MAG: cysteine--tRNA ligase [Opitutaceae bacterium]|jgi:cysteinyl-tRNA synthetase